MISYLQVEHFVQLKSRNFEGVSGIGKHVSVDGNRIFSAEMHPRSGIQSIYDETGGEIIR